MYLVLTSEEILWNWDELRDSPDNDNPEIKNPYEYIHKAKKGLVSICGVRIYVSDRLPEYN